MFMTRRLHFRPALPFPILALIVLGCAAPASAPTPESAAAPTAAAPAEATTDAGSTIQHSGPAVAKAADLSGSCTTGTGSVACTLPSLGNYVDLSNVLSQAASLDSSITTDTTMVISAVGGKGGESSGASGAGGKGGVAQTVTTVANYKSSYGTTELYYYLGDNGTMSSNFHGATGGASTIVSYADLNSTDACIAGYGSCGKGNVILLAGGGGGGGMSSPQTCTGGTGGQGGIAAAVTTSDLTDGGEHATQHCSGSGQGGDGGNAGKGGSGGGGGTGSDSHAGGDGADGIGGAGGPHHTENGPSSVTLWVNGTSLAQNGAMSGVGTSSGVGGEGQFRSAAASGVKYGPGSGGGGGYGGGGGGGGGGYDAAGGGGGGGGSYAVGVTILTTTYSAISATDSAEVVITFYP